MKLCRTQFDGHQWDDGSESPIVCPVDTRRPQATYGEANRDNYNQAFKTLVDGKTGQRVLVP